MKPTKQLTNVTRIAEIDSSNIVLYFNDKRANIADKETFLEKYPSTCFSDWRPFNETFYLAQSLSNSNWTLVNKDTGEILNENLWFKKIETFNDEFFLITSPETSLKTLVYKKMVSSLIQQYMVNVGKKLMTITLKCMTMIELRFFVSLIKIEK